MSIRLPPSTAPAARAPVRQPGVTTTTPEFRARIDRTNIKQLILMRADLERSLLNPHADARWNVIDQRIMKLSGPSGGE